MYILGRRGSLWLVGMIELKKIWMRLLRKERLNNLRRRLMRRIKLKMLERRNMSWKKWKLKIM